MNKIFKLVKNVFSHSERQRKNEDRIPMIRKYQTLYKTPMGREVLDDILSLSRYGEVALGKTNEETYFNLGVQNVGVEIANILNADLTELEKENKNEL